MTAGEERAFVLIVKKDERFQSIVCISIRNLRSIAISSVFEVAIKLKESAIKKRGEFTKEEIEYRSASKHVRWDSVESWVGDANYFLFMYCSFFIFMFLILFFVLIERHELFLDRNVEADRY